MKASRVRLVLMVSLFACLPETRVSADEPLPPPQRKEVWCGSHHYCAVMDPRLRLTTVYKVDGNTRTKLWAMPGWYRVAFLADDGEHLVIGYDGLNLIPQDDGDRAKRPYEGTGMIWFIRRGELRAAQQIS